MCERERMGVPEGRIGNFPVEAVRVAIAYQGCNSAILTGKRVPKLARISHR